MEITAIIISALAFILSIVTYFRFDRKIKQQEEIINAHKIEKINEEKKIISKIYDNIILFNEEYL